MPIGPIKKLTPKKDPVPEPADEPPVIVKPKTVVKKVVKPTAAAAAPEPVEIKKKVVVTTKKKPATTAAATDPAPLTATEIAYRKFHEQYFANINEYAAEHKTGPMKAPSLPKIKPPEEGEEAPPRPRRGRQLHPFEGELYAWVVERQREKLEGRLSDWMTEQLAAHAWDWWHWDPAMYNHYAALKQLAAFRQEHGHLPRTFRPGAGAEALPNERSLAMWVNRCRGMYRRGTLTDELREAVETIMVAAGEDKWIWDTALQKHKTMINKIVEYHNATGEMPKKVTGTDDEAREQRAMAAWCTARRTDKRKDRLDSAILEAIEESLPDFEWDVPRSAAKPRSGKKAAAADADVAAAPKRRGGRKKVVVVDEEDAPVEPEGPPDMDAGDAAAFDS